MPPNSSSAKNLKEQDLRGGACSAFTALNVGVDVRPSRSSLFLSPTMEVARVASHPHPDLTTRQLAVRLRQPLTIATPGRVLHSAYTRVGNAAEKQANKLAHLFGLGPLALYDNIEKFMGAGSEWETKLDEINKEAPEKLKRYCNRLLEYAFPTQAAATQIDCFKCLVSLTTCYAGFRSIFLDCPRLKRTKLEHDALLGSWNRNDAFGTLQDFTSDLGFAVDCLTETTISTIVENALTEGPLWKLDPNQIGLSVIEQLIISSGCEGSSKYSSRIATRYLGGVLASLSFWLQDGPMFDTTVAKLLVAVRALLKDLGVDSDSTLANPETEASLLDSLDVEGIDLLCEAIVAGVQWRVSHQVAPASKATRSGHRGNWLEGFFDLVVQLQHPSAEALLPLAWERTTSGDLSEAEFMLFAFKEIEVLDSWSPQSSSSALPESSLPSFDINNIMSSLSESLRGRRGTTSASDTLLDVTLDQSSTPDTIETKIDLLVEDMSTVIDALDEVAKIHPFIGGIVKGYYALKPLLMPSKVVVLTFKSVWALEQKKRVNSKKVSALYVEMKEMMSELTQLKNLKDVETFAPDGTSIKGRMEAIIRLANSNMKDCANACDVYAKQGLLVRVIKGSAWEDQLARFSGEFTKRRAEFEFAMAIHTALGIESFSRSLEETSTEINTKIEMMSKFFAQMTTAEKEEEIRISGQRGVVAGSENEDTLSKAGVKSLADLAVDLRTDPDAAIEANRELFSRKFAVQHQQLVDELEHMVAMQGQQVIAALNLESSE
uniref:Uncharacterized protein n=1 Tax=Mycena chlorophos TaxID=658473 RepID=A0ABQ0L104_MYCCL|nr:predicted protein [Mycena chlorophos]